MRTVVVSVLLAAIAVCHCWKPRGQNNAGKRVENRALSRRSGQREGLGPVYAEKRKTGCICEHHSPPYVQRRKRHMNARRSHHGVRCRCPHDCREKHCHNQWNLDISIPL
ncbi:uncharacterized protein O3C94_013236 [Discoglossus pictus]